MMAAYAGTMTMGSYSVSDTSSTCGDSFNGDYEIYYIRGHWNDGYDQPELAPEKIHEPFALFERRRCPARKVIPKAPPQRYMMHRVMAK